MESELLLFVVLFGTEGGVTLIRGLVGPAVGVLSFVDNTVDEEGGGTGEDDPLVLVVIGGILANVAVDTALAVKDGEWDAGDEGAV